MKRKLKGILIVSLLILIGSVVIANLYFTGDPGKFFLLAQKLEFTSDIIHNVDVEFGDRKVYLNVRLNSPATCKQVVKDLGINNIIIGEKTFMPTCRAVSKKLISIVYAEVTTL